MGSNGDIREIETTARLHGFTGDRRRRFGRFIESEKANGNGGTKNDMGDFTWAELQVKAREFKGDNR